MRTVGNNPSAGDGREGAHSLGILSWASRRVYRLHPQSGHHPSANHREHSRFTILCVLLCPLWL